MGVLIIGSSLIGCIVIGNVVEPIFTNEEDIKLLSIDLEKEEHLFV